MVEVERIKEILEKKGIECKEDIRVLELDESKNIILEILNAL